MSLTVLTDDQVRLILDNLGAVRLEEFMKRLSGALYEYSNNGASIEDGTYQQPPRIQLRNSRTAATTLFMPSICPSGMGVKVVTLTSPRQAARSQGPDAPPIIRPTGAITLLRHDGRPLGFLHASALTAFRTALSSSCLVARRRNVRVITAFGSGSQAYWHIRLALMMHGPTVKEVNIINRSFSDNARDLLEKFLGAPSDIKAAEHWTDTNFSILIPTHKDYYDLLKKHVQDADVIFCCTPSTEDLFSASTLTCQEARKRGRLIVAVGSYSPDMRELPNELLYQATGKRHDDGNVANNALDGGVIVVDTLEGVMKEAGEIIDAKINPSQLIELGELVMLPRPGETEDPRPERSSLAEFERLDLRTRSDVDPRNPRNGSQARPRLGRPQLARCASSGRVDDHKKQGDARALWLRDGNVIYKSVGLGLMDLVVGTHMIETANELGVGTKIDGF